MGRSYKNKTTAGWDLEVEWAGSRTSWLPLWELKEKNIGKVAENTKLNSIIDR